jgi:hypothetical protein
VSFNLDYESGMDAQIGLGDVKYSVPGVKAFGGEYFKVLGQSQSRQPLPQVAHIERRRSHERSW